MTGGGGSPTGITLDPTAPSHLWVVDSATDRVYQYDNAVGGTAREVAPQVPVTPVSVGVVTIGLGLECQGRHRGPPLVMLSIRDGSCRARSGNCHASIDAEHGSGDEAAAAAEQEQHDVVQLTRVTAPPERCPRQQEVRELLLELVEAASDASRKDARHLREVIGGDAIISQNFSAAEIDGLFDASKYLGMAEQYVDGVVSASAEEKNSLDG